MAGFFGLFDYNKPGPGVRKDEPEKKGVARYFDILGKRLWKIISLNFLYTVFSIVPFLIMYTVCNFCVLFVMNYSMSPDELSNWLNNGGTLLIIYLALFIYAIGGGGASACGMINVLRKYVADTHAWVWQDFWDGFKTNFIQGTIAYLIDCIAAAILIMNFGLYSFTDIVGNAVLNTILNSLLLLVIVIWGMMHVYIYPVMTTFKFKLKDIYKNSFIIALAKLPQTAAALFLGGAIAFVVIFFSSVVIYVALLIPIIMFGICEYTRLTFSYPLIKKYMVDPKAVEEEKRRESLRSDIRADGGAVFNDNRVEKPDEN